MFTRNFYGDYNMFSQDENVLQNWQKNQIYSIMVQCDNITCAVGRNLTLKETLDLYMIELKVTFKGEGLKN